MAGSSYAWQKVALVVTTIGKGGFLKDYFDAATAEGVLDRLQVIIIPDRKTPPELFEACSQYRQRGMQIAIPTLAEQETCLDRFGLRDMVPYDSDNRRNVGYLMALESRCDFVVSIDDDNYCRPGETFFGEHAVVCAPEAELEITDSSNGWINFCDLMEMTHTGIYPRGFPYKHRRQPATLATSRRRGKVRLNAGLWLGEPDLDAMTWLVQPAMSKSFPGRSIHLGRRAWSPVNTQNTALHRDLLPAYYFIRMGYALAGISIDRFGDIFSGYFVQACLHHMGDVIRVGSPCVDHRRNSHNYMKDATFETGGVWAIEDVAPWLAEAKLQGGSYVETYESLAHEIDEQCERFKGFLWTPPARAYFHDVAWCMRRWAKACRQLL